MADEQSGITFEELQAAKSKDRIEFVQIQAALEQAADKVYSYRVKVGDREHSLRFRRFTQSQVNLLFSLPFSYKFISKEELTDREKTQFLAAQIESILDALVDKRAWETLLSEPKNAPIVERLHSFMMSVSCANKGFDERLDNFLSDETGKNYGLFWLVHMRKTPSEVASLPYSDVKFAQMWLSRWGREAQP